MNNNLTVGVYCVKCRSKITEEEKKALEKSDFFQTFCCKCLIQEVNKNTPFNINKNGILNFLNRFFPGLIK